MIKGLKAKIFHYLIAPLGKKQNSNRGLTLLELIITVAILGIISAILVPNILDSTAKAKETEAQQNLYQFNKIQNLYFIENSDFATDFDALALGNINNTNSETKYYNYQFEEYIPNLRIKLRAIPKSGDLKEYKGGIRREVNTLGLPIIITLGCKNNTPGISNLSINIRNATCTNGEKLYGEGI